MNQWKFRLYSRHWYSRFFFGLPGKLTRKANGSPAWKGVCLIAAIAIMAMSVGCGTIQSDGGNPPVYTVSTNAQQWIDTGADILQQVPPNPATPFLQIALGVVAFGFATFAKIKTAAAARSAQAAQVMAQAIEAADAEGKVKQQVSDLARTAGIADTVHNITRKV